MTYFLLSKPYLYTYKYLQITETHEPIQPYLSNSLYHYLCDIKEKIHHHEKEWDIYKKYTNPYEYIHTNIPNKKKCISKYRPLSRAYFKMIELLHIIHGFKPVGDNPIQSLNDLSLLNSLDTVDTVKPIDQTDNTNTISYSNQTANISHVEYIKKKKTLSKPIKTFHLAEGPGGFIEAFVKYRSNPNDFYVGMTIINNDMTDTNIPGWKKSNLFLKENKNVFIETGKDKTGNILSIQNFIHCKEKYKSSMDFITADGGFDFSIDFNSQEINISRLLYAQIAYAVCMQKKGGTFLLKIFDMFMLHTIDLIYLLSSFYKKVYIVKLNTSRVANSEKYIICQSFLFDSCDSFYPHFLNCFYQILHSNKNILRFLNLSIPSLFINKIEEMNSIVGQQQIENIYLTLSLIETKNKNGKIDHFIKTHIQKCMSWCLKHNIPYHVFTDHIPSDEGILFENSFLNKMQSREIKETELDPNPIQNIFLHNIQNMHDDKMHDKEQTEHPETFSVSMNMEEEGNVFESGVSSPVWRMREYRKHTDEWYRKSLNPQKDENHTEEVGIEQQIGMNLC